MENTIENARKIIKLEEELNSLRVNHKKIVNADIYQCFELGYKQEKLDGNYCYYINNKEEREFIKGFIQECLQKRIDEKEAELNQYVISKKI